MQDYLFLLILEHARKANRVIIVGASVTGRKLLKLLEKEGVKVSAFFDNNIELQNQKIDDISVLSPKNFNYDSCLYIIASINYHDELREQLLQLGIKPGNIIGYHASAVYEYYKNLDSLCYEREIKNKYKLRMGQELNLDNPHKFTEKINWLILNEQIPEKTKLADKYAVKEYVRNKIGEKYVIPFWGGWSSFEEIDFDKLPNQFVLKCNHGCGMNIVIRNKSEMSYDAIKTNIDAWMQINFAYMQLELHYKMIEPRIIAEKYIEELDGNLFDYKVHCFNGEPTFLQVIGNRDLKAHTGYQLVYDFDWKRQDWSFGDYPKYKNDLKRPSKLNELYEVCKILSTGWRYVRVDFYIVDEQLLFGEMTFTPATGIYVYNEDWTQEVDLMMGEKIIL